MNKEKIAKTITDISSPAVVGAIFLVYAFHQLSTSNEMFLKIIFTILALVIVAPVLFTFFLLKKGIISNFHLKIKKERLDPLLFAMVSGLAAVLCVRYLGGTGEINKIMIIFYVMALGFSFITLKYKISGHAFVFTSAVVMAATFLGESRFFFLLVLLFPIGWSRLYLKEHTLNEFLLGTGYALVSFSLLNIILSGL